MKNKFIRLNSLEELEQTAKSKAVENIFFKKHLRGYSSKIIDEMVHQLDKEITPKIDCTQCGNCCKKLEPELSTDEIERLANLKNECPEQFKQKYILHDGKTHFLKTKPCMFLQESKCSIYSQRPQACAAFPHLDLNEFKYKSTFWSNYFICPIVYNVIESLKGKTGFDRIK
ncbi:MAG: YkgJ family cysteine cluster protein [Bacteroidia bacterium]